MAVKLYSCLTIGIEGKLVEVEIDILAGLPAFSIVGLGDTAVHEAKERIRSALKNSGFEYPQQKKIINLAPAHLRKHGPHFDVAMAIGLLVASGQVTQRSFQDTLLIGELALDGSIKPVCGIVSMAIFARKNGWKRLVIPYDNLWEARFIKEVELIPVRSLKDLMNYLKTSEISKVLKTPKSPKISKTDTISKIGVVHNADVTPKTNATPKSEVIPKIDANPKNNAVSKTFHVKNDSKTEIAQKKTMISSEPRFDDIQGNEFAKRALEIAAAGGHHILLIGPPGVGKTLLAKAFVSILPPLTEEEMIEVMQIYSVAGCLLPSQIVSSKRPFREVHQSCSLVSLLGGGVQLQPGEISLAHRGVLFLDEIAEFSRVHLESLRQPLEAKEIFISRSFGTVRFPAQFILVASMNPCPCGFADDPEKQCTCRPYQVIQYKKKLSGPLLDRIDLMVKIQRSSNQISFKGKEKTKAVRVNMTTITQRIKTARFMQKRRFLHLSLITNSEMGVKEIKKHCVLSEDCRQFLAKADQHFLLSGRQYHQILKVARTIADLDARENIQVGDIAEALQYRIR